MEGTFHLYFEPLMLSGTIFWPGWWKKQIQNSSAFLSCFPVLQGRTEVSFPPLPVTNHAFFHHFIHAGMHTSTPACESTGYISLTHLL